MVTQEMMSNPSRMKPTMRTAHPNPTTGMSFSRMMGKRTPPLALPPVVTPIARARRFLNQCPRTATAGLNLCEVHDDERCGEDEQAGVDLQEGNAKAEQDAMGEEHLVGLVLLGQRHHHQREHGDDRARGYQVLCNP